MHRIGGRRRGSRAAMSKAPTQPERAQPHDGIVRCSAARPVAPSEGDADMRNGLEITRAAEGLMIRVPEDFGGFQPLQDQEWAESVMTEWPTETGMVTIDLSRSKAVASAFLAQLLVLRREVSARGGVVILDRPNDRFRRVLYYMGVSHLFRVIPEPG